MLGIVPLLDPPPVGSYELDFGTESRTLKLQADGGYRYLADGCFHHDESRGEYRWSGDRVVLLPPAGKARDDNAPPPLLRVVRWSPRTFLVEPRWMPDFVYRVWAGWRGTDDAPEGMWFRDSRLNRALTGSPALPALYARSSHRPISARVVRNVPGFATEVHAGSHGQRLTMTFRGFIANVGRGDGVPLRAGLLAPGGRRAHVVRLMEHEAVCGWEWSLPTVFARSGEHLSVQSTDSPLRLPVGTRLRLTFD